MADWTQVSRLGTGSFIPKGTQKPTEGTGFKNPTTLGENQMAKVTYRGIQYDTETQKQKTQEPQQKQLVYRGIAVKGGK